MGLVFLRLVGAAAIFAFVAMILFKTAIGICIVMLLVNISIH
jgi:hypothetical protein